MLTAEAIVTMLRLAWTRKTEGPNAELVRRHGTLMLGFALLDASATEDHILKLATGGAALRQVDDGSITYHDVRCPNCRGVGKKCSEEDHTCGCTERCLACPFCKGDGFSPPR